MSTSQLKQSNFKTIIQKIGFVVGISITTIYALMAIPAPLVMGKYLYLNEQCLFIVGESCDQNQDALIMAIAVVLAAYTFSKFRSWVAWIGPSASNNENAFYWLGAALPFAYLCGWLFEILDWSILGPTSIAQITTGWLIGSVVVLVSPAVIKAWHGQIPTKIETIVFWFGRVLTIAFFLGPVFVLLGFSLLPENNYQNQMLTGWAIGLLLIIATGLYLYLHLRVEAYEPGNEAEQNYVDPNTFATLPGGLSGSKRKMTQFKKELGHLSAHLLPDSYIEQHIRLGATNPAIVMSTSPNLLIAAYAADLDAVVMLQFNKKFTKLYNLQPGTALITVNTYSDGHLSPGQAHEDMIMGENYSQWSSFHPIIAEFASDNLQHIHELKQQIHPNLWNRTHQLGLEYLSRSPKHMRDGNPYLSQIAAKVS